MRLYSLDKLKTYAHYNKSLPVNKFSLIWKPLTTTVIGIETSSTLLKNYHFTYHQISVRGLIYKKQSGLHGSFLENFF